MRAFLVSIILVFFSLGESFSLPLDSLESKDSLVVISDLSFGSDYEKNMYMSLLIDEDNIFGLLMSIESDANEGMVSGNKKKLFNEINLMSQWEKPTSLKKKNKYYQRVYKHVHETFLRKYELINHFNDVFAKGEYNCVTACALYGLVFSELGIDFSIKETPTHVYIVIDPGENQFLIETTTPQEGVNKVTDSFKTRFVKELEMNKLISQSEYSSSTTNQLFDKYYYNSSDLGMKEVVGVQYWNEGVYFAQEEDYSNAINALQKSYLLYPNEKVEDFLLGTLALEASRNEYETSIDSRLIVYLSRFGEDKITDKQISDEFLRLNQNVLIDKGDITSYRKSYEYIIKNITRDKAKEDISYYYNYEMARTTYHRGRYENGIAFSVAAYALRPANMDAENLLLGYIGQIVENDSDFVESLQLLDSMSSNHPMLLENNRFGEVYLNLCLVSMDDSAKQYKIGDAKRFKEKFEKLLTDYPYFQFSNQLLGSAYSQLAVYYFKMGNYSYAKKMINDGLKHDPRNFELNNRKRVMD